MGSQYVPQPDVHRDMWADTPTGDDEDYVDAWGSGVLSGGDQAEARRQYHQQVATSTGQQTAEDVPMSVDQQPQLQDNLPTQTYVPPEVRAAQESIQADIFEKAKAGGRSQADKAAGGKHSPVRTTGALSTDQVRAELNAKPERESS